MANLTKRPVSLHLRVWTSLYDTAQEALRLGRNSFQCFLMSQMTGKHISVDSAERNAFIALREREFGPLFVHGSYWINMAAANERSGFSFLQKELALAQSLSFTHYVIHPGAAIGCTHKLEGIDHLVRRLNGIMKSYKEIIIVLENTAHAGLSIGSDLQDFALIQEKLDIPERVLFCLDTAHAYAWGYDVTQQAGRDMLFALIQDIIGFENVALLHLNDTVELLGSKKDRHALPGTGFIGSDSLKHIMNSQVLQQVPVIVEVPTLHEEQKQTLVSMLDQWTVE